MKARSWLAAWVLVTSITNGVVAQEQATTPPQDEQQVAQIQAQDYRDRAARGLFEAGSVAYEEGRYEEALEHFTKAYELSPTRHLLLYNIASSQDRLRRDSDALKNFERYLELNPTASNHAAIRARVEVLKQAVARQAEEDARQAEHARAEAEAMAATAAPPPSTQPAAEQSDRGHRRLPPVVTFVGAGLTAALVGVTIWSGLNTNKARDQYEDYSQMPRASASESKNLYEDGLKRQTRTNVLAISAGVVGVATGVIAAFFTDWHKEKPTQPQVSVGLNHFQLGLSHGF